MMSFVENYFFVEQTASMLQEHYYTIMSIIAGLYIGFLAFMYPQIIDFKRDIEDKFTALYKIFARKILSRSYLVIISGLLIFSLSCIFFSIKDEAFYFIGLNLVFAITTIILNFFLARRMETYLFNPDNLYKKYISSIDFRKDLSDKTNMDAYLGIVYDVQSAALYFLNKKNFQTKQIEKYIDYIVNSFWQYIAYDKKTNEGKWSSNNANNTYYNRPMEILVYISQVAMDENKPEISIYIASKFSEFLEKIEPHSFMYSEIQSDINMLFLYPILANKSHATSLLGYAPKIFADLIKASSSNRSMFSNLRPHNFLFRICKEIINNNLPLSNLFLIRDGMDRILSLSGSKYIFDDNTNLWELSRYYIVNLTFDVLAYLYYQNRFQDIREYTANHLNSIRSMLPRNMQDIVKFVFIKRNSIFDKYFQQEFNSYTSDKEYKLYILFLIICTIKQRIDIHKMNIQQIPKLKLTKEQKKSWTKSEKRDISELADAEIDPKDELLNLLDDKDFIGYLDKFFMNKEIFELFKISGEMEEYRRFILEQLEEVQKFIKQYPKSKA